MSARIHEMGPSLWVFHCPGCGYGHHIDVRRWTWNGSHDRPTFMPSILVNQHDPASRCHSYVKDGQIQFLSDCHHALKGQTVALPVWDGA